MDAYQMSSITKVVIHPKCTELVGRAKDYIDLRVLFS